VNGTCIDPNLFVTDDPTSNEDQQKLGTCFTMQNVPGDGDCMFLAVALAATISTPPASTTDSFRNQWLPETAARRGSVTMAHIPYYNISHTRSTEASTKTARTLRNAVADILQQQPSCTLFISHNRTILSHELLKQASNELHIHPSKYIQLLRQTGGLYGGGPELTILCHLYQRPIHIYEIDYDKINTDANQVSNSSSHNRLNRNISILPIIERGVFGQGVYDIIVDTDTWKVPQDMKHRNVDDWDLHILVVDVSLTEKHACALFPVRCNTEAHIQ
jgi:hypothetical protein